MAPPGFSALPPQRRPPPIQPAKLTDFKMAGALGSGATARVYEAVHIASGRPVAIKILEQSDSDDQTRELFAREALLLGGVSSKHVGALVGFGFERGQPFLVLERLHGETLDAKLRRDGPVRVAIAVRWIEQLIVGVRDCHDQQVIHRDIKPSNIFVHQDGFDETVKLIDFGVARLREITGDPSAPGGLTSSSQLIGSMGYMAPEQFTNAGNVDFTADLYAVGVVVFRTLTGRLPFVSRSLEAVVKMKVERTPPLVSSMPGMPADAHLDAFVTKALAREPGARFQNAREMLEEWWNVITSLDDEGATDVTRGFGRVDESYAGPLTGAPELPTSDMAAESEDDRTLRRRVPNAVYRAMSGLPAPPQVLPSSSGLPSSGVEATLDAAPNTVPNPGEEADDDGYVEEKTRLDPALKRLVEQELELQRKRQPPSE